MRANPLRRGAMALEVARALMTRVRHDVDVVRTTRMASGVAPVLRDLLVRGTVGF